MPSFDEYLAIQRCQTWNVWPERTVIECHPFPISYGPSLVAPACLFVCSYVQRSAPERYLQEETTIGPLVWDGETPGLHHVREEVLKAPSDTIQLVQRCRNTQRGEIDICIKLGYEGELPSSLIEALRATTSAVVSLVNLQLADYLIASAPFQIRKILPDGGGQVVAKFLLAVHDRQVLDKGSLRSALSNIAAALLKSHYGEKLRVALELYAAHFTEQQARVRFLLLVIAIESLAKSSVKHQAAIDLLKCWREGLVKEMNKYEPTSDAHESLKALFREIDFRSDDSIRSQIRKLFANLPNRGAADSIELQRRALHVYDRRSALVHDGHLPVDELSFLEAETRDLLEMLFFAAAEQRT